MDKFSQPERPQAWLEPADAQDRAVFSAVAWHSQVDGRRIVSGIIYAIKHGLMWRDAPKGYDSDAFRAALAERGIAACIPPLRHRKVQHAYDKQLYRQLHKIENVFARIKDWRRVATR